MKKMGAIFIAVTFLMASSMAYGGDDDESRQKILVISICSPVVVVGLMGGWGISATVKKKKSKNEAAAIFNEATSSQGERSNLEILAMLYEISVDEVIDIISMMAANGELDIAGSLVDDDTAQEALSRLNQALESHSQKKGINIRAKLDTLRNKLKTAFPMIFDEKCQDEGEQQMPTTLELATFYRDFFKETNAAIAK